MLAMERYEASRAADRAGVDADRFQRFIDLGLIAPDDDGLFTNGQVLRAELVASLVEAGLPLDGLAQAIGGGQVSLDFLDEPVFDRFSALSDETFSQAAERTGVPVDVLSMIREAAGSSPPPPDARMRDAEMAYLAFVQTQLDAGFDPVRAQRLLRVHGESLRRMADSEVGWFQEEIVLPAIAAGKRPDEVFGIELAHRLNVQKEAAILDLYRQIQARAWTGVIIEGLEMQLAAAGLHSRLEHPPAMCFLDITGYTRLTQEQGDMAAADLATELARLVERTSGRHGGRPVKWLGDGVMFHFKRPGDGVVAALEMVDGVGEAGLPPAHVGLHAGPVIYREGDYYGQTVNVASRIADYARPGEVLVSQDVVDESEGSAAEFREIGPVELKGVGHAMRLHAATLTPAAADER
jgi:adenylate cyclase